MSEPQLNTITVNGVSLAYFERGEAHGERPTLLFVHATGFHGRVWDVIADAFVDHHIIALEQRGHGRSEAKAVTNWSTFGEDQAAFVEALDLKDLVGVGHSMGGHGMIQGASLSSRFTRLLLLDPTVAAPEDYGDQYAAMFGDELHPAAKRRADFASVEEMVEQIGSKSSFPLFDSQILRDYCQHGLVENAGGGLTLACRPEVEARVYMSARSNGAIYDHVERLDIPVTVVRAKLPSPDNPMDFSSSPTWPGLAARFPDGHDIHWSDSTHFIPMQYPRRVIDLLGKVLQA